MPLVELRSVSNLSQEQFFIENLNHDNSVSVPSLSLRLVLYQASHWGQFHNERFPTSLLLRLVLYQASAHFSNNFLSTPTQLVGTEITSRMPECISKCHYFLLTLHVYWQMIDTTSNDRCGEGRRPSMFVLPTTFVVRWDVSESPTSPGCRTDNVDSSLGHGRVHRLFWDVVHRQFSICLVCPSFYGVAALYFLGSRKWSFVNLSPSRYPISLCKLFFDHIDDLQ